LVNFTAAHRSEAATSSALDLHDAALGPVLGLPGVALDRRALTIPPTQGIRDKKADALQALCGFLARIHRATAKIMPG
jgi:hypothetical protein